MFLNCRHLSWNRDLKTGTWNIRETKNLEITMKSSILMIKSLEKSITGTKAMRNKYFFDNSLPSRVEKWSKLNELILPK